MRILELSITNYRGFGGVVKFPFAKNFTVIAGVNGRGKTAILDGLALLFSHLLHQISPAKRRQRRVSLLDVHTDTDMSILSIKANCAGIPLEFSASINGKSGRVRADELYASVSEVIRYAYGDPSREDDQSPLAVYYTTDRAGYRFPKSLPEVTSQDQSMAYSGALLNKTVDYKDFIARYRVAISQANEETISNVAFIGQNAVSAIGSALEIFLDGFSNLTVAEKPPRLYVEKNGEKFDIRQLSDGERSFIALVCDLGRRLALANPELKNPLEGAGVVLIDELELHLHPKWQREAVRKLRKTFPNIQFIATTHSPFIIQSLNEGELINLDPKEFGEYADESIEDIAEFVMGVKMPQKSKRYLEMMEAAEDYFRLIREVTGKPQEMIEAAKQRLNELSAPFSDDPAFQALLNFERKRNLKE